MIRLAAILSLFLSLICCAWSVHHGVWTWTLFLILGIFLWCISSAWDTRPW